MQLCDRATVITPTEARQLAAAGIAGALAYIGGPGAGPATKTWTPAALDEIRAAVPAWGFVPTWVAPAIGGGRTYEDGRQDGAAAADAMVKFGWHRQRGRVCLLDTERSTYTDQDGQADPERVRSYTQGWTFELQASGFVPGQYGGKLLLSALAGWAILPAFVLLADYIRTGGSWHHEQPPALAGFPELRPWAHGARCGVQWWNEVQLLPGRPAFDLSVAFGMLNP